MGRPSRTITVHEIVQAVTEEQAPDGEAANTLIEKVLEPFRASMNVELAKKMEAVTLEGLLRQAEEAGMQRPNRAPISFSI